MPRRKQSFKEVVQELNLVPVMNMVMCLIPVVLVGSSQIKVGVLNVNARPYHFGDQKPQPPETEKPLNLTVAIGEDGYHLRATGADLNQFIQGDLAEQKDSPEGPFIKKKGTGYNQVELYNQLVQIKQHFPNESMINLSADPGISFKHLVAVMDVARVRLDSDSFQDLKSFQNAGLRYHPDGKPDLLWPDTIFAVVR